MGCTISSRSQRYRFREKTEFGAVSTKPLDSRKTVVWRCRLTCQNFKEEVAFDVCIGDRIVTNGILECGHSRLAACRVEEQTKGYVDLHRFSLSD